MLMADLMKAVAWGTRHAPVQMSAFMVVRACQCSRDNRWHPIRRFLLWRIIVSELEHFERLEARLEEPASEPERIGIRNTTRSPMREFLLGLTIGYGPVTWWRSRRKE